MVLHSNHKKIKAPHTEGVALMLLQEAQQALIRTKMRRIAFKIVECYASMNDKDEEVKDLFNN